MVMANCNQMFNQFGKFLYDICSAQLQQQQQNLRLYNQTLPIFSSRCLVKFGYTHANSCLNIMFLR